MNTLCLSASVVKQKCQPNSHPLPHTLMKFNFTAKHTHLPKFLNQIPSQIWYRSSLLLFLLYLAFYTQAQTRYYVNPLAAGANDGSSWANAFTDLQAALAVAQSGDSVWIAQGVYYATSGTDRMVSFEPRSGVRMYGGFAGTETQLSERAWETHRTILSGDIGVPGDSTDNTNNILFFSAVEEGTIVDGMTFLHGYSETPGFVYDVFQREGCGGAIYVNAGDEEAYLRIQNCRFERNFARLKGGAVFIGASADGVISPQFLNCSFAYNSGNDGVAVYCNGYADKERIPDFGDCTFSENRILTNAPLSIIRYINAAKNDTLHFWGCIFEKHAGGSSGWRNIWTKSDNHIQLDGCVFRHNKIAFIWSDFSSPTVGSVKSTQVTNSLFTNNANMLEIFFGEKGVVSNCIIKNSTGALFVNPFLTEISNCIIDSCKHGGALLELGSDCVDCTVSNMIISNNVAINSGGVFVWAKKNDEFVTYQNINMINNDRLGLFGANQYGDSITFRNFNFIGNRFYLLPNAQTVPGRFQNCIFQGNTFITPNYYALYPSLTFENCSVDYPDSSYFPPNVTCINTLFNQDPLFRDAANQDYSLQPCSPLINAGTNAAVVDVPADITGAPRIQGGRVDIGAFESPAFALATVPEVKPACTGASNGSISIEPAFGCEPLDYQWSPPAGNGPELNGLPPGQYVYTVTDGKGRQISDTLTIQTAPMPDLSLQKSDISCGLLSGGSLTASVSSGAAPFHYQWLPLAPDTATLTQLQAGDYALTITDANGCLDSAAAQISLVGAITLQVSGQGISCYGVSDGWLAATPVTGAAPFAWQWAGWPGTDSLAQPLSPGLYAVTVLDAYGCSASFAFPAMSQPDSLWAVAATSPQTNPDVANGGAAVTGVFGGTQPYDFVWNTGSTQQAVAGLEAGSYTVTVADKNGCETVVEVVVQLVVGTDDPQQKAFLIYPNPAADWVSVLLPESLREGAIELLDASGRILLSAPVAGNPTPLNLQSLPSAQYFIRVQDRAGKTVFMGKLSR